MKALLIANTIITTKEQAINLINKLNTEFMKDKTYELSMAIDSYVENIVNAGFLTWEETDSVTF